MKPSYSILAFLASLASAQAQIIASQTDTFSGGGGGSGVSGIYSLTNAANSTFDLGISPTIVDGAFLDAADDGYALLHRTATVSTTIGIIGALGTVAEGDVGKKVSVDIAFRTTASLALNSSIRLDGTSVGGQGLMVINTFGAGNAPGANNTNLLLSTVALGATHNPQRTASGPLEYTIQLGDVGKVMTLQSECFDSSNNGTGEGTRNTAFDAISITIIDTPPVAEFYWDGTGTGWESASAWSLSSTDDTLNPVAPPDGLANVNFGSNGLAVDQTVNLNGNQAAAKIVISSPVIYDFVGGTGTSTLTLGASGLAVGSATLGVNLGSAVAGQEVNLALAANQTWSNQTILGALVVNNTVDVGANELAVAGAGDTVFNSPVSGTGSLRKYGSGNLTLNGPSTLSGAKTVDGGSLTVTGDGSGSTGNWVVRGGSTDGTSFAAVPATLNFASGSTVAIASGKIVQVGNTFANGGFQAQTLNSEGTVTNDGSLTVGRAAFLNLNGGIWTQNGNGAVASQGGGSAKMTVNTGASFVYANVTPFVVRTSTSDNNTTELKIDGGTFTTGTSFNNTVTPGGVNSRSQITLDNGGTLKLSADVADLFTTDGAANRVASESGQGVINTNGFNTTLNVAVSGAGGLTKDGEGTLTTTGTNSYTGETIVNAGSLSVAGPNLDDASSVTIASGGAKLNLAFTGEDSITSLTLGATTHTSGTFGSVSHPTFITGSGKLVVGAAAPTYSSWASGLGLSGNPEDDFEKDGVTDGVEYVLGTDPKVGSTTGITATQAGGSMIYTFLRDDSSETVDVTLMVEAGETLQSWPQVFLIGDTTGNSSAGVEITENGSGKDTVVVTIPTGSAAKLFARMKVVVSGL